MRDKAQSAEEDLNDIYLRDKKMSAQHQDIMTVLLVIYDRFPVLEVIWNTLLEISTLQ